VVGSVDISGLNSGDHFYFALKTGMTTASITLSTTMGAGGVFVPGDVNYVMSVANKTSNAIIEYIKVGTEARMVL
jgi:Flp pilus assembly protein CpaB